MIHLHDVEIINEQSGVRWRVGTARIDAGRIVIESPPLLRPPSRFFGNPASTFTICATDPARRARRFQNVTFDRDSSAPRRRYVFR